MTGISKCKLSKEKKETSSFFFNWIGCFCKQHWRVRYTKGAYAHLRAKESSHWITARWYHSRPLLNVLLELRQKIPRWPEMTWNAQKIWFLRFFKKNVLAILCIFWRKNSKLRSEMNLKSSQNWNIYQNFYSFLMPKINWSYFLKIIFSIFCWQN